MVRVALRRVGADTGKKVRLPASIAELLELATSKLELPSPATNIFFKDGDQCDDLELIDSEELLYISCGEPFAPPSAEPEDEGKKSLSSLSAEVPSALLAKPLSLPPPLPPTDTLVLSAVSRTSDRDQLELDELARLREEVSLAQEQLKCAKDNAARWEAEVRAAKDVAAERKRMVVGRDDTGGDEVEMVTMLSELLIEARMSAAQYAFERDEAKGQAQRLHAEVERLGNAVRKLQEHTTKLEAKYVAEHQKYAKLEAKHKAVCQQYEGDVAGLIELRAQADEANRRLSMHESKLGVQRGHAVGFEGGC